MTKMDTDSESQDSDDGRRFRFETTRKDISMSTRKRSTSPRRESKHTSHPKDCYDDRDKHKHDQEKSKSKSFKCKLSKSRYEEERERIRDSKRHKSYDKDRERRHKHHSRDHSHDRNYNEQSHIDKQISRCHNRTKRHSWSRSRDRSIHRSRSPSTRYRSQEEHRKNKSSRKDIKNENISLEYQKEHHERKSSSQTSAQICKNIDLSDYNVLSETDENSSDPTDRKMNSRISSTKKYKKRGRSIECEESKRREKIDPIKQDQASDEYHKVNSRNHITLPDSSNYNPSTVSDRLSVSPSTLQESKDHENKKKNLQSRDNSDIEDIEKHECKNENIESMVESDEFIYGPVLPPRYSKKSHDPSQEIDDSSCASKGKDIEMEETENVTHFIGPCLPNMDTSKKPKENENKKDEKTSAVDDSCEESDTFGPILPPHLQKKSQGKEPQNRVIGPTIPDGVKLSDTQIEHTQPISSDSEVEDAIGPLPVDHPALQSSFVHEQLERRAERIKNEFREETDSTPNNREEWMTELPPAHSVSLGISARKFRIAPGPDMSDRSCWTDTPAQKAEKRRKQATKEAFNVKDSDKPDVKNYNEEIDESRKQEKSLLEIHQDKLRKKKKAKEKEAKLTGESTRRPFDRDIDLQINRVTESQKKSILRKAQCLDDRFTRGGI